MESKIQKATLVVLVSMVVFLFQNCGDVKFASSGLMSAQSLPPGSMGDDENNEDIVGGGPSPEPGAGDPIDDDPKMPDEESDTVSVACNSNIVSDDDEEEESDEEDSDTLTTQSESDSKDKVHGVTKGKKCVLFCHVAQPEKIEADGSVRPEKGIQKLLPEPAARAHLSGVHHQKHGDYLGLCKTYEK